MTPLDEIKRIRDAATPGPWRVHYEEDYDGFYGYDCLDIGNSEVYGVSEADARLIALAPELADRVLAAEAEIKRWEQAAIEEADRYEKRVAELEEALREIADNIEGADGWGPRAPGSLIFAHNVARATLRGSSDD